MNTNVYIDGYNLYYGSIKRKYQECKWLNLAKFSESLANNIFENPKINLIRYFTAKAKSPYWDKGLHKRQAYFLRALSSLPNIKIHYGFFSIQEKLFYLVDGFETNRRKVLVRKPEEKGSDVNLASYLLLDAFMNNYNQALIISGDGDLAEPIKIVKNNFGKNIFVWNPASHNRLLKSVASDYKCGIAKEHFEKSLFNDSLEDERGMFHKPKSW